MRHKDMENPKLNTIYQGDTLAVLKTFPSDFVDTIITSCPYWIGIELSKKYIKIAEKRLAQQSLWEVDI